MLRTAWRAFRSPSKPPSGTNLLRHFYLCSIPYYQKPKNTNRHNPITHPSDLRSRLLKGGGRRNKTTKSKHAKKRRVTDVTNEQRTKNAATIEVSWAKEEFWL